MDHPARRVILSDTLVGAEPEDSVLILEDPVNHVIKHSVFAADIYGRIPVSGDIQTDQSGGGPYVKDSALGQT